MVSAFIIYDYFIWHYVHAWRSIAYVLQNLLWYTVHFFSIPQLTRSWLAPYKRITEQKKTGFSLEDFAGRILINVLSRVIGCIARTVIISCGLCATAVVSFAGVVTYVIWALLPFLLIGTLITSASLIITSL